MTLWGRLRENPAQEAGRLAQPVPWNPSPGKVKCEFVALLTIVKLFTSLPSLCQADNGRFLFSL